MWDDFNIGEGRSGTTAVKTSRIFQIPDGLLVDISENDECFWVSRCICDLGGHIFKDTKEGQELSKLIDIGNRIKIQNFLDLVVLREITPGQLRKHIRNTMREEFERGRQDAKKEIRTVLGVAA